MKKEEENLGYNADMFEQNASTQRTAMNRDGVFTGSAATVDNNLRFVPQDNAETLTQYAAKTFLWMFMGLLATFAISLAFFLTGMYVVLYSVPALPFILAIAELGVVIGLSAGLKKMSSGTARVLFFVYAVLNGLTFASLFAYYGVASTIYVFGFTALYFGALAAYGWITKRDLTSLRPILLIGLVFLLLFWVVSMFLNLSGMETIVCFIGLAIFMGYTAYDTQMIKRYYAAYAGNAELSAKTSVLCALQLYLDFVNLFLYLLRLLGRRSN